MDTPPAPPGSLPLPEAARQLGVSVESLRKRCQRRTVRAVQVAGRWHVYLDGGTLVPSRTPQDAPPSRTDADLTAVLAALSRLEAQQAALLARIDALAASGAVVPQEALDAPPPAGDTRAAERRPWWRRWWEYI